MQLTQQIIAKTLIDISVINFTPDAPITFKSGILSPIYMDNRIIPAYPDAFASLIDGFAAIINTNNLRFDLIAGIAAGGIPYSAALGYALRKPSIFIRKEAKGHGKGQRIEGADVENKHVLLIEDLVTTGSSSLSGVDALREAGAIVTDCMAIVSYGFTESQTAFDTAGIRLHTLTNFNFILDYVRQKGDTNASDLQTIENWLKDPYHWAEHKDS